MNSKLSITIINVFDRRLSSFSAVKYQKSRAARQIKFIDVRADNQAIYLAKLHRLKRCVLNLLKVSVSTSAAVCICVSALLSSTVAYFQQLPPVLILIATARVKNKQPLNNWYPLSF